MGRPAAVWWGVTACCLIAAFVGILVVAVAAGSVAWLLWDGGRE